MCDCRFSMYKYFKHPVRVLFAAHVCSLILFSYLYWNNINNPTATIQLLETKISFITIAGALSKAAGNSISDWIRFVGFTSLLYLLFLIGLKMVSSISFKELLIFVLITIPVLCFTMLLSTGILSTITPAYLFSTVLLLLTFGLLKISGHWNNIDDGLPD